MATATEVLDPPSGFPARPFARVVGWLPPFLLVVASVLARLPALVNARGVSSDAAVVGLQAMHILHGEWSWFLWGAGYQASLDAALVAAGFAITGPSALTLMVVPLIGYLILVGLTYDVLRRAVGRGGAAVACLPLVFAPQPINGVALYAPRQWAITTTVLAVWLASRACGRRAPLWLAGSGFVAGFAVYLDLFTLQMMPAVGVFALWCAFAAPPERPSPRLWAYRGRAVGALVLGLAAGVAVIAWSRAQPVADGTKAGLTLDKVGASWTLMVDQCLPYLLGVKVFVQDPMTLDYHLWPAPWPLQVVQAAAAATFAAAVCWAAVAVVGRIGPVVVRRLGALGLIGTAASIGGFLVVDDARGPPVGALPGPDRLVRAVHAGAGSPRAGDAMVRRRDRAVHCRRRDRRLVCVRALRAGRHPGARRSAWRRAGRGRAGRRVARAGDPLRGGPVLAGLPAHVPVRRRPGGRAARRRRRPLPALPRRVRRRARGRVRVPPVGAGRNRRPSRPSSTRSARPTGKKRSRGFTVLVVRR